MASRWLPLESNPEVMNKYIKNLGVPSGWQFYDVFGLDPELLAMVPRPVVAVVLLYPISEKSQSTPIGTVEDNKDVYFIKQTISNACGTIGIIHAIANNTDKIQLEGGLGKFLAETKSLGPAEKAEKFEESKEIQVAHEASAQEGQTEALDEEVKLHFVAFIHSNGGLYELDGRKEFPTRHGNTKPDSLLEDTAKVAQEFMKREPGELNFTLVALAKAE